MIPTDITLQSENFQLRIPDETDLSFVLSTAQYPGFHDGMLWDAPKNKEELMKPLENSRKNWIAGKGYGFTIETKENNSTRVGRISIRKTKSDRIWNVGFWTHPKHQRKGIMSEVLKVVTEFGFSKLNAIAITAQYAIWNKASEKVLINNNFKFVKHIEKGFLKKDKWISENEFALTKEQWLEKLEPVKKCDFCEVLKNNEYAIFENDRFVVLLDFDPISLGHVLVCPKGHYSDFHELPDKLIREMMLIAKRYIVSLRSLFSNSGYSMMLNAGEFNDLKHCHLHIFPRKSKEEFQWTYKEENMSADAKRFEILKKLLEENFNVPNEAE